MPSWPIHLALAHKINKKLNLGDNFIFGSIMPDIPNGFEIENPIIKTDKNTNHFQEIHKKMLTININNFLNKYKNKCQNPLIKGYLAHLMADNFFNKYTYENHYFFEGKICRAILKDGRILKNSHLKPWQIKQRDFKIFDNYLIKNKLLPNINKSNNYNIIKECPIDDIDIIKAIKRINGFKNSVSDYDKNKYQMFTEEELLNLYNNCYKEILEKLKRL